MERATDTLIIARKHMKEMMEIVQMQEQTTALNPLMFISKKISE